MVSLVQRLPGASSVVADDEDGAYQATTHLLDLGHRHLLYFFDAEWGELFSRRIAGIHRACHAAGLDPVHHTLRSPVMVLGAISPPHHLDIDFLYGENGPDTYATHQQQTLIAFLRAHREYTALLAQNDAMARRLWYLLTGAGFRVPDDISLIGFDDTDSLLDAGGRNCLTSVQVPLRALGQTGARLMLARIAGECPDDQHLTLPVTLIPRAITAPAAG